MGWEFLVVRVGRDRLSDAAIDAAEAKMKSLKLPCETTPEGRVWAIAGSSRGGWSDVSVWVCSHRLHFVVYTPSSEARDVLREVLRDVTAIEPIELCDSFDLTERVEFESAPVWRALG